MTGNFKQRALKVLLVDDDADTRQMVTLMLEKAGHEIRTMGSGSDALALLSHERMDVILLDILMPELDGLSLLETIRMTSEAPVLMLTAVANAEIMQHAYVMGADDYIVKPFTREKLLDRIYRMANKSTVPTPAPAPSWTSRYWLDAANHILIHNGAAIDLTQVETIVLQRLMESAYQEVSDLDLHESGWGTDPVGARTLQERVESTIRGIQLKLEDDPAQPKIMISTAEGFVFNPESA